MNRFRTTLAAFVLCLCLPSAASALDVSPVIKVTPLGRTISSWDGAPLVYPAGQAEISAMMIEIAVGAETGWHLHPVPSFAYVLQGMLEVRLRDGRTKRLGAGEALVEVVNTQHNGRNIGTQPVKLVVFYAGAAGSPLTLELPPEPRN
jgi:quercetin dioxygenase-like cupin family protein